MRNVYALSMKKLEKSLAKRNGLVRIEKCKIAVKKINFELGLH
jgi:hypothetical protein